MNDYLNNPEYLTQLLLDASALINTGSVQTDVLDLLELYTREYIYKIHKKRVAKLKQITYNMFSRVEYHTLYTSPAL